MTNDKIPADPQTFDPKGNPQFKQLRLDPDLADGSHWTVHAVPNDTLLEIIRNWMENASPGDEFTIGLIVMSDDEADALPDI